ncbi:MAG: topoisomerase DNA-binding C4 zinc finger domain-containing protein, partial [Acidobacteriota bacterium]
VAHFADLMEVKFTARMEEELDKVGEGEKEWLESLREYYTLLSEDLAKAGKSKSVKENGGIPIEELCPRCGKPLVIREGRFGRFKACSGFPACTFKESLKKTETKTLEEICPKCGAALVQKRGRYGYFIACSSYPKCRYIKKEQAEKKETGIACPLGCGGMILERKTRRGKVFYGCSRFPKCRFATWDVPVDQPCPRCGKPVLLRKVLKAGTTIYCRDEKCGFKEKTEEGGKPKETGPDETRA